MMRTYSLGPVHSVVTRPFGRSSQQLLSNLNFGQDASNLDVPADHLQAHRQALNDHLEKVHSPLFQWMAHSNPPLKRLAGAVVNWFYFLWKGFVKDAKALWQWLVKPKPRSTSPKEIP